MVLTADSLSGRYHGIDSLLPVWESSCYWQLTGEIMVLTADSLSGRVHAIDNLLPVWRDHGIDSWLPVWEWSWYWQLTTCLGEIILLTTDSLSERPCFWLCKLSDLQHIYALYQLRKARKFTSRTTTYLLEGEHSHQSTITNVSQRPVLE